MSAYIPGLAAATTPVGDEQLETSQKDPSVTITATTISAAAADNSYNDSGNGFVTAGFAVGDDVVVGGFTTNAVNNINIGRITALTAGKMTIGGTDGDVIVDEAAGDSVTISKWKTGRMTAQQIADLGGVGNWFGFACSDEVSAITAATDKLTFRMPFAGTITDIRASLNSACVTGTFTVDINEAGTSILSTKLTFDATETTTTTATTPYVISDGAIADDAEVSIDVDDAGDGTATGLKVWIKATMA